ncbi:FAD-binding oxidoreductase [Jannaschia sp. CCS1]|uniref:FAD-binding oxidoreductase n=1 Tax=Jannaschia sp. (strain CCS1) TaxID=290400 RepID=UPI000053CA7E|nr:FAD-binding oxidoreductase [Jannaschia sp. CCS1]ABD55748.1 FAD linked oxidase-like protein [Jannaschia sp. CCS1]
MKLSGWGRFPNVDCTVRVARSEVDVRAAVAASPLIARGNGRAYGDAALNRGLTLDMTGMDRMLSFEDGVLVAEAGVLLGDIIHTFLPRGWFPMVTPGTKYVSLGGAIAADVHGKNHHLDGSFRSCVDWVDLMGPDGAVTRVTREDDLFDWTLGGMGLTGVILRAQIRLRAVETSFIAQETRALTSLTDTLEAFEDTLDALYSVAWIDCSDGPHHGHSLLLLGRHATPGDLPKRQKPLEVKRRAKLPVPFGAPPFLFRGLWLRALNGIYWRRGAKRAGHTIVDWDSYFYPLDALANWNRLYGRNGFLQFQCALPLETAADGLAALMAEIAASQSGSVLSVLKRFGPQSGHFSFPMPGYTLALDFPANERSLALMERLDAITLAHKGRFYLAKDARMPEAVVKADARAEAFAAMRTQMGLRDRFASEQSERLGL